MYHKITAIGYVGQDPQLRYTPDGTPVTDISVATTQKLPKAGHDGNERPCPSGWKESQNGKNWELTSWLRFTCWRGLAEVVARYVRKGSQVFVEGELNGEALDGTQYPRVWEDKNGVARASFEYTAKTVKFLGGRGDSGTGGPPIGDPPPEGFEEDTLPF